MSAGNPGGNPSGREKLSRNVGGTSRAPAWADLVGLEVSLALAQARALGFDVRTFETGPPWPGEGGGLSRVVRVRVDGPGRLELTVARETFARTRGPGTRG